MKFRRKLEKLSLSLYCPNIEGKTFPEIVAIHKFEKVKRILKDFWDIDYLKTNKPVSDNEFRKASNQYHNIAKELREFLSRACSKNESWCEKVELRYKQRLLNFLDKYHD